jgi:hypothetical protein
MGAKARADREAIARLIAELDQVTEGLARCDPNAILNARKTLVLLARDASPDVLWMVFRSLTAAWEAPAGLKCR